MSNIQLRPVSNNDAAALQSIGRETFCETFAAVNTEENLKQYLETSFSDEKVTAELNDENSEFYFAVAENRVIGYLKVNFGESQTELKDNRSLEIERIYVLKEFHGNGTAQLLYNKAIQVAQRLDAEYIWLGVWEENQRAIRFYKKNGFKAFDKHIFKLGDDTQTDIMMKLNLNESEMAGIRIVEFEDKYATAFKELNEEWITAYFTMEESDYKALGNPQANILDKGGKILVALDDEQPVGVCALIKMNDPEYDFELAKMAVSPSAQGKGIAMMLCNAAIKTAKDLGATKIYLESSRKLTPAMRLYEKLGVKDVTGRPTPYSRCDIQMELDIR
ncbi:MAG: GNAT family N-acetyltransferase [Flavobacterium sp.]|nr:MAG: GNAT family N-acetyltransferase [Flavobacterium sp.]